MSESPRPSSSDDRLAARAREADFTFSGRVSRSSTQAKAGAHRVESAPKAAGRAGWPPAETGPSRAARAA